jgi:hypothetical protein
MDKPHTYSMDPVGEKNAIIECEGIGYTIMHLVI